MAGRGFVKLHRESMEHEVFQDDWLWRLFCWCIMKANFQPSVFRGHDLERGSFVTGRMGGSEELGVSASKFYRGLKRLEKLGSISVKSNRHFSVISVCNYSTYQINDESTRTTGERTGEQPVSAQVSALADTEKECSIRERTQEPKKAAVIPADPMLFDIAWKAWPVRRRSDPFKTKESFARAVAEIAGRNGGNLVKAGDWLLARIKAYCASPVGRGKYVRSMVNWLDFGKYDEDDETWLQGGDDEALPASQYKSMQPIPRE